MADEIGYGNATAIAAIAADTHIDIARMNAMRKAKGRPTIEEEEESDRAWFRERMAAGKRFDPDVEAWARGE
ncbi:hypothetical protein G3O06_07635 [Burkholderia sp. Ac-20345]|uniref:hypothetical protein n=1 Tax=Burkholderia sp. Ac-20345 TaxID=2703891 RepID=UPI00197B1AFA|nr:hypothetical protein [Burkholderia sp. Ac-20345]MBN3777421.1 hypothetical protein [Burkholderia sp. Ac-20345]